MQDKDLHNLEKADLLKIIYKQQEEIESLKVSIKDLENKLNQKEANLNKDASLKLNKILDDAAASLRHIKLIEAEANQYLSTIKLLSKSELENDVQNITNEEKLKETNEVEEKELNNQIDNNKNGLTDTSENTMLILAQSDLIVIKSNFWSKVKLFFIYTICLTVLIFSLVNIIILCRQDIKTFETVARLNDYIKEVVIDEDSETSQNIEEGDNENNSNDSDAQESENNIITFSKYEVDFSKLKKINSDVKGWITVNGINLSFPVVQAKNNTYYLRHSFDKTYNVFGWIFADFRNKFDGTDKNIIIYGHNRKDGTMFSPMTKILEPSWYNDEKNRYITFTTEEGQVTYEVFSIYQIKVEDYYIRTDFASSASYQRFLNTIKSRSIKKYDVELSAEDQILTLSTCGSNNQTRIVLHARKK